MKEKKSKNDSPTELGVSKPLTGKNLAETIMKQA